MSIEPAELQRPAAFAQPSPAGRPHRALVAIGAVGAVMLGSWNDSAWAAPDGQPHPVRYDLSVRWSPSSRTLAGTEAIRVRDDGPGTLPLLWLRLWPNDSIPGEADGCRAPNLTLRSVRGAVVDRYAVACSAVALRFPTPLAPGETAVVSLRFRVRVPSDNTLFGRSAGIDLFGRVVPVVAVRDDAGWHLDPDSAIGDPAYTVSAAWRAAVRVPDAMRVASTGAQLSDVIAGSHERVVVVYTPHARDFGFAVGRLSRLTTTVNGVAIRVSYSSGQRRAVAAGALRYAADAVRTYSRWYGPYGSREVDLVLTKLGVDSQELPEIVFTDPDRGTVAHELAHMWFYGIVGNDQYREPWLDESFASWSEEQLEPGTYACDARRPLGDHRGGLALGLSYYESHPSLYADVIYRGGSCALTALARALGRNRLLALLRQEVSLYRHRVIHTAEFMALLTRTDAAVAARWANLVGLPLT